MLPYYLSTCIPAPVVTLIASKIPPLQANAAAAALGPPPFYRMVIILSAARLPHTPSHLPTLVCPVLITRCLTLRHPLRSGSAVAS